MKSSPHSLQLEKPCAQQRRPNADKNKQTNKQTKNNIKQQLILHKMTGFLPRFTFVSKARECSGAGQTEEIKERDYVSIKYQFFVYRIVLYLYIHSNKP